MKKNGTTKKGTSKINGVVCIEVYRSKTEQTTEVKVLNKGVYIRLTQCYRLSLEIETLSYRSLFVRIYFLEYISLLNLKLSHKKNLNLNR